MLLQSQPVAACQGQSATLRLHNFWTFHLKHILGSGQVCQFQSFKSSLGSWVLSADVIQSASIIPLTMTFLGILNKQLLKLSKSSFNVMFWCRNQTSASLVWEGCGKSEQWELLNFCEKEVFSWLNHYVNEAGAGETAFLSGHHHTVPDWLFKKVRPLRRFHLLTVLHTASDKWIQMTESWLNVIECVFY